MWETSSGVESTVEYGTSNSLGNLTTGTSITGEGSAQIHITEISGLQPDTKYYYRAKTGSYQSNIHEFKTAPSPGVDKTFTMVAFSDMQSHTWNYEKIVNDGIIKYSNDEMSGNLAEDIGIVIVPGDLVGEGYHYPQWSDHFFSPAEDLYAEVPIYPTIGNHDIWELGGNDNSSMDPSLRAKHFRKYFDLPLNGTAGYYEEWWYKDYANVRIIGLNSEFNDNQQQLDWLEQVLNDTKTEENIDFVFAQMHHPHKSELYNSGKRFSTDVVELLEDFSTSSGKPSIQFFGHTHGYSRGQSRDHGVVMLNVGSGGGRLDNWNEDWPRRDYEEFSVSHDEFGFVLIEVSGGDFPKFELKKIGMGNEDQITPYTIRDEMIVKKVNEAPQTPTPISPIGNSNQTILQASDFIDSDNDGFGSAHFQLSRNANFTNLILDDWKQHENWYMAANTQAGDDLTDVNTSGLTLGNTYYWRVRYRDKALAWSDWSQTAVFNYTNDVSNDPVANFSASSTVIYEGESVTFSDLSLNNPTNRTWTFEGGSPYTSSNASLIVTYNTVGTYNVSLEVSNTDGSNTKTIENYIVIIKESAGDTIAYYPFSGNPNDYSGNERHGIATNTSFVQDATKNSQVATFNNQGFIDIQTGPSSSVGMPLKDITIATWVKIDQTDEWGGFVGLFQDNGAEEFGWVLGTLDQKFSVAMTTVGNPMTYLADDTDFELGTWYHVAATYDGNVLQLYVDGILVASSTAQSGNISYPTNGWLTLGRYKDDNEDDGHTGALDDVLILKRALTETEIQILVNDVVSGISNLDANGNLIQLATPNPMSQNIVLGKGLTGEISFELLSNLLGSPVLANTIEAGESINISHLSKGVYILHASNNGKHFTEKLIKQ